MRDANNSTKKLLVHCKILTFTKALRKIASLLQNYMRGKTIISLHQQEITQFHRLVSPRKIQRPSFKVLNMFGKKPPHVFTRLLLVAQL